MSFFSIGENYLEFQNGNEVVRIIAWGTNSLRVVSAPAGTTVARSLFTIKKVK